MALHRNISIAKLSRQLKMDRHTLSSYLKLYDIRRSFSTMNNAELDDLVCKYKQTKPDSGVRYLVGSLRIRGIRIQRKRLALSIRRVDGLGQRLRQRQAIQRHKYTSPRPNALWHCDGHHKLILWGIVIHGMTDGYDRVVSIHFISYNVK